MEKKMILGRAFVGIYLCALACVQGCGNQQPRSLDVVKIQPSVLDLGTIAAAGQQVSKKFTVKNVCYQRVEVQLIPACSCVIAGSSSESIGPQQMHEFELLISTHGRSGDFRTELVVDAGGESYRLPIKAVFVPQVYSFPSRVVLYPTDKLADHFNGSVSISAPPGLWEDLQLQVDNGYRIDGEDTGEKRRFRIFYDGPAKKLHPSIIVTKKNQETPVLKIPVISGV